MNELLLNLLPSWQKKNKNKMKREFLLYERACLLTKWSSFIATREWEKEAISS